MEISVFNTIKSELAINQVDGIKLYQAIVPYSPTDLTISFINVNHVSTAFLNESIGKFALNHPLEVSHIKFIYPEGNEIFNLKVIDVIENALLGEEYSNLVDNALASL